jgi:hypothetical protein
MAKYIPNEILTLFLKSYENGDVWQVHSGDRWLTVWLYANSQIDENKNLPFYKKMKEEYYKLVEKYLDLKISSANDINLYFESKEDFDTKYRGSWQFYYT